jgi:hypothetical protein
VDGLLVVEEEEDLGITQGINQEVLGVVQGVLMLVEDQEEKVMIVQITHHLQPMQLVVGEVDLVEIQVRLEVMEVMAVPVS